MRQSQVPRRANTIGILQVAEPTYDKSAAGSPQEAESIQAGVDYGIDMQMLKDNLARTPTERVRRHQIALNTVERLRKAKLE